MDKQRKKKNVSRILSIILCGVILLAMAVSPAVYAMDSETPAQSQDVQKELLTDKEIVERLKGEGMTPRSLQENGIETSPIVGDKIPLSCFSFENPHIFDETQEETIYLDALVSSLDTYKNGISSGRIIDNVPRLLNDVADGTVQKTYSYFRAHVGNTEVYHAGVLTIGTESYVYYVSDRIMDDMTVYTILRNGEKIVVEYNNAQTHTIDYEFVDAVSGDVVETGPGGWSESQVFGANRIAAVPHGEAAEVSVSIPRGYYAEVSIYRDINDDGSFAKDDTVALGQRAVLGGKLAYKQDIQTEGSGSAIQQIVQGECVEDIVYNTLFSSNKVEHNILVSVKWKKYDEYTFNAKMWSNTVQAYNRIFTSNEYITNFTGPDFTWEFRGITSQSGGAKYTWEMDNLVINGTAINVPTTTLSDNGLGEQQSKVTMLPTGTKVTVEITGYGGTSAIDGYRDYRISFEDCYEDITITGGNMVSHVHKEVVVDRVTGVSGPQHYGHWSGGKAKAPGIWTDLHNGSLIGRQNGGNIQSGENKTWSDPIRFKKQTGFYGKADIVLTDKDGEVIQKNGDLGSVLGENKAIEYLVLDIDGAKELGWYEDEYKETCGLPTNPTNKGFLLGWMEGDVRKDLFDVVSYENWTESDDGYYYFRTTEKLHEWMFSNNSNGVTLLTIKGTPIPGAIEYVSGEGREGAPEAGGVTNMPSTDMGGVNGYNCENNQNAIISTRVPRDKTGKYVFDHWEVLGVEYTEQENLIGNVSEEAFVSSDGTVKTYMSGEEEFIERILESELSSAFRHVEYPSEDGSVNGRAVITLRAVWRSISLVESINYNVFYYVNGVEIFSKTHSVPQGAQAVTDLYQEDGKTLSTSIQNILNGNNHEGKAYTGRYLVDERITTMGIDNISNGNNNAYIYLVSAETSIDATKQWDMPNAVEGEIAVERPEGVTVQLQHQHAGSDNWHPVPDTLLTGAGFTDQNPEDAYSIGTLELNNTNGWRCEFNNIPRFENDDLTKPFEYRIAELDETGRTLTTGESWSYRSENGDTGEVTTDHYIVGYSRTDDENGRHVSISNVYLYSQDQPPTSLIIAKQVTGAASKSKEFTFKITVSGYTGNIQTTGDTVFAENGTGGREAQVKLKSGEFASLSFPEFDLFDNNPNVSVTEVLGEESSRYEVTTETSFYGAQGDPPAIKSGTEWTGDEFYPDRMTLLVFKNHRYTGDLTMSKTVTGNMGDRSKLWLFEIALDENISGQYTATRTGSDGAESVGSISFENGMAHVRLSHGQKVNISGLPHGVGYTVTEEEGGYGGYTTTYSKTVNEVTTEGGSGDIDKDNLNTVEVVNEKNVDVDNGINLDSLPYIMILASVICCAVLLLIGSKRRTD